jgi:hypothetical protein
VGVRADDARRLEAVEDRHANVHQHDVWKDASRQIESFSAVGSLGDDLHLLLGIDQCCESAADGGLIVGDEHTDHARPSIVERCVPSGC